MVTASCANHGKAKDFSSLMLAAMLKSENCDEVTTPAAVCRLYCSDVVGVGAGRSNIRRSVDIS